MSKTIDVRGYRWTIHRSNGHLYRWKDGNCEVVTSHSPMWANPKQEPGQDIEISERAARQQVASMGYTITAPAESPAKPEPVICSACRTFGCDDHVPDAGKMVNPPAVVKPDPTPDVPVVDAVWVEDKNGRLCGYGHWNAMHAIWGYDVRSGTARIVRLAPDPDLAATVKRLEERLSKLEATVSDLQSDAAKHDNELELLRLKAATTTAKVRVVLPEIPGWATDDRVTAGWNSCIVQVKLALSAAGIDVVKEAGK